MTSIYEEVVSNFDLDFLHQTPGSSVVQKDLLSTGSQDVSYIELKKRIANSDYFIKRFHEMRENSEQKDRKIIACKEECKNVCIDYQMSLETCANLKKELSKSKEFETQCTLITNKYDAQQSQLNQLQVLLNERETAINGLKIENQLEKAAKKEGEKRILVLQKEIVALKKDMKGVSDKKPAKEEVESSQDEVKTLRSKCLELEAQCNLAENKYEEVQSQLNQLQIENRLNKAATKDFEKLILTLQKENDVLRRDLKIALDKKQDQKQKKELLEIYTRRESIANDGSSSKDDNSDTDMDNFDVPSISSQCDLVECSQESQKSTILKEAIINGINKGVLSGKGKGTPKHIDGGLDSIRSPDAGSIDTGRGSSLAFSDSDKCFNSPEYYSDSPFSATDIYMRKEVRKTVDMGTNTETIDCGLGKKNSATSPIRAEVHILPEENNKTWSNFKKITSIERQDEALSPIFSIISKDISTSPIKESRKTIGTSPDRLQKSIRFVYDCSEDLTSRTLLKEKQCLELNSKSNLCDDYNEYEIESILNSVRLDYKLMSPIPKTPKQLFKQNLRVEKRNLACEETETGQEKTVLETRIDDLSKEVMNIKQLLMKHLSKEPTMQQASYLSLLTTENISNHSKELISDDKSILESEDVDLIQIDTLLLSDQNNVETSHIYESNSELEDTVDLIQIYTDQNSNGNIYEPEDVDLIRIHTPDNNFDESSHTYEVKQKKVNSEVLPKPITTSSHKNLNPLVKDNITGEDEISYKSAQDNVSPWARCDSPVDIVEFRGFENIFKKDVTGKQTRKNIVKSIKSKKISKLDKMRKKLLPKSKIKVAQSPTKKLRPQPKLLPLHDHTIHASVDSKLLNSKVNFEKAVKVMIESKARLACQDALKNNNSDIKSNNFKRNIKRTTRCNSICEDDLNKKDNDKNIDTTKDISISCEKRLLKRASVDLTEEIPFKRVLRSSVSRQTNVNMTTVSNNNVESPKSIPHNNKCTQEKIPKCNNLNAPDPTPETGNNCSRNEVVGYDDIAIFTENNSTNVVKKSEKLEKPGQDLKDSFLCEILGAYGTYTVRISAKKVPDTITNSICKKIEDDIAQIIELPPHETKQAMSNLIADIKNLDWKHFLSGLMKYLKDPQRKQELLTKTFAPRGPSMTKPEQILVYVVSQLKNHWRSIDIHKRILDSIEYALFQLNHTPVFEIIESMSHFYAVLCRYLRSKSRLRLFILNAMYCIQFKAVPLIKQCLDVWMNILPLAHMGMAKSPLVTCLVYLLHFYKCEDRFNRVQEIRNILFRKYSYQMTEWNDNKILELFRDSIKVLKGIPVESKMLRIALIILAKRQGTRWCQNNIIVKLLNPMIKDEKTPNKAREFCISMIGPLLRPYPVDMKAHCEIAMKHLESMLQNNPSRQTEESIVKSLLYLSKHNEVRVNRLFLTWRPKYMSPALTKTIRQYVRAKPLKSWKKTLSNLPPE